jgi:Icc-related predicted phosphoesterase
MKCLFVSDLHGNTKKINSLFKIIEKEQPDGVFIGGDIFPNDYLEDITTFFKKYYIKKIKNLKDKKVKSKFFIILGNDDPKIYENLLLEAEKENLIYYINNKVEKFYNLFVVGYSYIPPTPFILKDWERYDISRYIDPGTISPVEGKRTIDVDKKVEKFRTISEDLKELSKKSNPKKTIYLFHSPPYKTNFDRADLDGKIVDHVQMDVNVGSIAIKRFIKKIKPFITLHGHVHESSRLTGSWKEKIDLTYSFSAAYEGNKLSVIFFDTDDLKNAFRKII